MNQKITPTIPFTAEAYQKNKAELDRLIKLRAEVMERLKAAREMGDLSENGAYKYAKFELGDIGRRMRYLKHVLAHGYIAETDSTSEVVSFGKTVELESNGATYTFFLVSEHESDLTANKLSIDSPIGKALLGKKAGESAEVTTPRGTVTYSITAIH